MAVYELCTSGMRNGAFVPVIFRFENFRPRKAGHKIPIFLRVLWWARQGLNLRPHPCEGCALPLSYAPAAPELSAVRSRASNQVRGR